jgi:hypothetical protein
VLPEVHIAEAVCEAVARPCACHQTITGNGGIQEGTLQTLLIIMQCSACVMHARAEQGPQASQVASGSVMQSFPGGDA